jgi:hypothetical protein
LISLGNGSVWRLTLQNQRSGQLVTVRNDNWLDGVV